MNCPECKELKIHYDKCIKQHIYNKLFNWDDRDTSISNKGDSQQPLYDETNTNPCGKYFEDYKSCIAMVMNKKIEDNKLRNKNKNE